MGDGETAEGSVWEAAASAHYHRLASLCAIVDVNGLGQSQATQFEHDLEPHRVRWQAFGWHTLVIDGHDLQEILDAYATARRTKEKPTVILARTLKGKGLSFIVGAPGWHGKALKKGEEADRGIRELESALSGPAQEAPAIAPPIGDVIIETQTAVALPAYAMTDVVATREAFGVALARLGSADPRVVALDGDVKNSTFTDKFEAAHPDRFFQMFIAEQVMVGAAMGLAARGAIPFATTFAAFLTRAADFIRMAAISGVNIKLVGSHAGVSIGEDGPSQMALEDLSMTTAQPGFVVLYPSDAVSAEHLVIAAARHIGPVYIRVSRPKVPVLYENQETFPIGGSKVLRRSDTDAATVIGAGVTVFEALKAYDELLARGTRIRVIDAYSVEPIDVATLIEAGQQTGRLITVEDHYRSGGLGDAVARCVASSGLTVTRLAVGEIPRSGRPDELLDAYGISARHIVTAVLSH